MSNYHYNDQGTCRGGCLENNQYSELKNTANFSCDQPCLCRWTGERSSKDKMYYNWFVLNQQMQLPPGGKILPPASDNNCKQK